MSRVLRMGTRGSALALTQSRWVASQLCRLHPTLSVELTTIKTSGDRFVDQSLSEIGGKGLFVKEIEEALLDGTIDFAVHSMKDVPNELAPGLVIAAVPQREDPRDVIVSGGGAHIRDLPPAARVGTSSLRRTAMVRAMRPDVVVSSLRGNVDTRLRKLDAGEVDAILLAAAGLTRLGLRPHGTVFLDPDEFVPAVGQGALAVECRNDETTSILAPLDDEATRIAINAERAFLHRLGGSCRTPLAAYAQVNAERVTLQALIASPDGLRSLRAQGSAGAGAAAELGHRVADDLLRRGAAEILTALSPPVPPHVG